MLARFPTELAERGIVELNVVMQKLMIEFVLIILCS